MNANNIANILCVAFAIVIGLSGCSEDVGVTQPQQEDVRLNKPQQEMNVEMDLGDDDVLPAPVAPDTLEMTGEIIEKHEATDSTGTIKIETRNIKVKRFKVTKKTKIVDRKGNTVKFKDLKETDTVEVEYTDNSATTPKAHKITVIAQK